MRRWIVPLTAVLLLATLLWIVGVRADTITGEPGAPLRLMGPTGQILEVTHSGSLKSILTNMTGTAVTVTGTSLDVNCTGCSAASVVNVAHISAQLHVRLVPSSNANDIIATHLTGRYGSTALVSHFGALAVTCYTNAGVAESCAGAGGSGGGDAVNVFHQSTIRHISSVTHVAGGLFLTNQAGTPVTVTGTALDVNCTGCAAASVVAVSHISAAVHLAGGVVDQNNNALRVTGVTVFTIMGAIDHVSSTAHVSGTIIGFGKQNTDVTDVPNSALKVSQSPARWPVSHVTSVTHVTLGFSPKLQAFQVTNCGSTARMIISSNPNRRSLKVRNVGTLPIWVNGGHITVSSSNGWTLHAVTTAANTTETSVLELPDFQGQIDCVANGPVKVEVMELLR